MTVDEGEEEGAERKYSQELECPERRCTFAQRLREALNRAQSSESSESSYAVGISVAGASTADNDIRYFSEIVLSIHNSLFIHILRVICFRLVYHWLVTLDF